MKKEVEQRIGARRRKTEGSLANVKIGEKQAEKVEVDAGLIEAGNYNEMHDIKLKMNQFSVVKVQYYIHVCSSM